MKKTSASTMKRSALLLVPDPGFPEGLLREGPCGAKPPVLARAEGLALKEWVDTGWGPDFTDLGPGFRNLQRALVLVWEGEPVPEGMHRLADCLTSLLEKNPNMTPFTFLTQGMSGPMVLGKCAEQAGLGTLVLLDEEGKEIPRTADLERMERVVS
jgi:hypothetical protein